MRTQGDGIPPSRKLLRATAARLMMPAKLPHGAARRRCFSIRSALRFDNERETIMPIAAFFAVGIGAFLGALMRWGFGILWNSTVPQLPLGTLAANLIGGFIIGAALASFEAFQATPLELRLFITTGFCGGLTTFSTFSAEAVIALNRQQFGWFFAIVATHVVGSIMMTFAGMMLVRQFVKV
jgi:CrcB protein